MYQVSVLAYDGVFASALAGVVDLLNLTGVTWNRIHGLPLDRQFKVQVVSRGGQPVRCNAGLRLAVDNAIERVDSSDLVLVPTIGNEITSVLKAEQDTLEWLRFLHAGGADLASNCTGAFLLAEAGLLDGRRATTHWGYSPLFRQRYPQVNLNERELITRDGNIFCAGGGTAWRDLTILLVERYCGADMARELAKSFVIDVRNDPQSIYAGLPAKTYHRDEQVQQVQSWLHEHYAEPTTLADLAQRVHLSPRQLQRRFIAALGEPPLQYLQRVRIEASRKMLERGATNLGTLAEQVGYQDVSSFSRLFKRHTGLSPSHYRQRFARVGALRD
ncbi:GlxA family transcriptional regulator [Alloalcanivorax xenomutans]|jgi:transcriptional regulator GlxA family with amidase domain|uniref:GlxA family transcriptional regulator n=1 Tax=Alloalcanivorax xenomutans TaxID=1094342 RepID=A0A9Q3W9A5_9GAMM|nr:GlxA family transcriptional regulator [Alloalcanivorax xenomutans]ERS11060.1 AraC family transcriptional regulator [Alcanivorax sp. PN-3]KYZ87207.1 AraC family transcriptional regulator [Alcanivorax sp. KX64203]MBA4721934.1 GlxA family transcriptional regulator [Alcanivorax sp.]ARB45183.1 AraC family transcriptional regulator [Alloalcanivorax xenomutans]MCE7510473.1 GlxA family transcriptional regulator [Alloalcanivorax xenomutans]